MNPAHVSPDAAMAHAAFCLRDNYYREMARLVAYELVQAHDFICDGDADICEVGAGIGVSTLELLEILKPATYFATEPDPGMNAMLNINVDGRPGVMVIDARALDLDSWEWKFDAVVCCQVLHLLKADEMHSALLAFANVLKEHGVLAFDLGPSSWKFRAFKLFDHRASREMPAFGEVVSEFGHPLYRMVERHVRDAVKRDIPEFDQPNLWPPAANAYDYDALCALFAGAGFDGEPRITEHLVPLSGKRVLEFIRNGWSVFFRNPPLSHLPMERKLRYVMEAVVKAMECDDFEGLCRYTAYHPSAVIIAQKK